jgi:replicative DNA helicase
MGLAMALRRRATALTKIFFGASQDQTKGLQGLDALVVEMLDRLQETADIPGEVIGIASGFVDLDRMTTGFRPGDLIVLSSRPGMGKTALATNIAEHIAFSVGLPVAMFSLDMAASNLTRRIVGSVGSIDLTHLRTGKLPDEEWPRLIDAIEKLRNCDLHIDESMGLSASEVSAKAHKLAVERGQLGLIVVDHLQLMCDRGGSRANRVNEVGETLRDLKTLAGELKCPILILSQLTGRAARRCYKRPMLGDLRDSAAIEHNADIIMFLDRDDNMGATEQTCIAELTIAKQRNGPSGTVKLTFIRRLAKFENPQPG